MLFGEIINYSILGARCTLIHTMAKLKIFDAKNHAVHSRQCALKSDVQVLGYTLSFDEQAN